MLPKFSIRLFSQSVHKGEASDFAQALFDRLPETDLFFVVDSWRDPTSPREHIPVLDQYVDLFICLGSSSFWGELIGLKDLERWVLMGKTVLWLHIPPVSAPVEPEPVLDGMEVLPREAWMRIDPVIDRIVTLAGETRIQRRSRATRERKASSNPFWRRNEDPRKKYSIDLSAYRANESELERDWRHLHAQQWDAEREADEERWKNVESNARSDANVSAASAQGLDEKMPEEKPVAVAKTEQTAATHEGAIGEDASRIEVAFQSPLMAQSLRDVGAAPTDSVNCAVYAPPQWEGGVTEIVQLWIHTKEDLAIVEEESRLADHTARRLRSQALGTDISRGARLSFALRLDVPCEIDPPIAAITWRGEAASVSFAVLSSPVKTKARALGTVEIRVDHFPVPIGVLHFRIELVPQGGRTENVARSLGENARSTDSVFISYASADRVGVLRRVQGLKALGIRFFRIS